LFLLNKSNKLTVGKISGFLFHQMYDIQLKHILKKLSHWNSQLKNGETNMLIGILDYLK